MMPTNAIVDWHCGVENRTDHRTDRMGNGLRRAASIVIDDDVARRGRLLTSQHCNGAFVRSLAEEGGTEFAQVVHL